MVKSPWSSWQFGMNYIYENRKDFKGRGDKAEKYPYEGIFVRSTNLFERVVSPLSKKYEKLAASTNPYSASSNTRKGLNAGYGITGITQDQEPIVTIEINAAVKPKSIQKNPITLHVPEVIAPMIPNPNIPQVVPPNLNLPEPKTPSKEVLVVKPKADPFTGYYFDGTSGHASLEGNSSIYSGIDPASLKADINTTNPTPAAMVGMYRGRELEGKLIENTKNRFTNLYYINSQTNADKLTKDTFYLRGHYSSDAYDDSNTRAHAGISNNGNRAYNDGHGNGIPDEGVVGIHALNDLKFKDLKFNLYGRAGAMTNETWRHGILDLENVTVNMYNSDNMDSIICRLQDIRINIGLKVVMGLQENGVF